MPTQAGAAASPLVESADMPPGVAMLIRELREQLKEQKSLVKELLARMSQGAAAASQSQSPADTPQTAKSKARRQIPRDGREEEQDAEIRESKKRKSNGDPDDGGDGDDDDFDGSGDDEDDDQDEDEALSSVSESPSRGRSATRSSGRQERSKIKPLTNKQLCPPEKYCHKSGDVVFKTWRESFRALIDAQGDGVDWEEVLDDVECKKGTIIDSTVVTEIQRHFKWDKSELKVVMSNLYHMLQQFTKGRTQLKITTARKNNVFDPWRVLYYDGMAVSETALFLGKGKVWNRPEVKPEEFATAVDLWEEDRDFLAKHSAYKMDVGDQHFAILTMCPADTRKEILREYSLLAYWRSGLSHARKLICAAVPRNLVCSEELIGRSSQGSSSQSSL